MDGEEDFFEHQPHHANQTSHHYAISNSSKNAEGSVHAHAPAVSIGTRHSAKSSQNKMKKDNIFNVRNDRVTSKSTDSAFFINEFIFFSKLSSFSLFFFFQGTKVLST
jgi:hypothetical protein